MKLYEAITKENWIKDEITNDQGHHCLHGWITALYPPPELNAVEDDLVAAIKLLYPERMCPLYDEAVFPFNDDDRTSVDDVIRVCKVADR